MLLPHAKYLYSHPIIEDIQLSHILYVLYSVADLVSLIASLFYSDPIIDKQLNHTLYVLYLVGDLVCHYLPANHDIVDKSFL